MSKRLWKNLRLRMEVFCIWFSKSPRQKRVLANSHRLSSNRLSNRVSNRANNSLSSSLNSSHSRTCFLAWIYQLALTCLLLDKDKWISTKWTRCYRIQWWGKWLKAYLATLISCRACYKWVLRYNKWPKIIHSYKDS